MRIPKKRSQVMLNISGFSTAVIHFLLTECAPIGNKRNKYPARNVTRESQRSNGQYFFYLHTLKGRNEV